jgi:hypothetical protein
MRVGFRIPSLAKRLAARISIKRVVRHRLGLEAPRGWGWLTDARRTAYNRLYRRSTFGCSVIVVAAPVLAPTDVLRRLVEPRN